MIRFQLVDDNLADYSVKRMCTVLGLNRSSYYKWKNSAPRRRARLVDDAVVAAEIQAIFDAENGVWGARRITAELNDRKRDNGTTPPAKRINRKRVARLMRAQNLFGFQKKRRVKTTARDKGRRVFADLVNRDFTACAANRVLVGDITYLPIADGANMYLATVIDCFSRKLVGFAIANHMRTELVEEALENASHLRGGLDGAIFHSDHGSVYTSSQFQATCKRLGVAQSMGAVGTSADNSLAESFNAALKREVLKDAKTFANQLICRRDVFRWCVRYNTCRRHTWCGYQTPDEFESQAA